jgi:hypothetical protein
MQIQTIAVVIAVRYMAIITMMAAIANAVLCVKTNCFLVTALCGFAICKGSKCLRKPAGMIHADESFGGVFFYMGGAYDQISSQNS